MIRMTIFTVICLFHCAFLVAQQDKKKPNIVLIYADDLGVHETGAYGQPNIRTPFIDRMSREGMRFTRAYSGSPVCAPARCILLTGKHAGHAFIRGNYEMGGYTDSQERGQMPLPDGTVTIAHQLKRAGYQTAAIGKWGLGVYGSSGAPERHGFDYFYGYTDQKQAHNHYPTHLWENGRWDSLDNPAFLVHRAISKETADRDSFLAFTGNEYAPRRMMEKTASFLRGAGSRPFFLYLPVTLPHLALQAPASAVEKYSQLFTDSPYRGGRNYAPVLHPRATYAAMVSMLDSIVGTVFSILKEKGLEENTLVIFSSDNGATFNTGGYDADFFKGDDPLRGAKMDLYEGGIRVPFIAWWKGKIKPGTLCEVPVVQYDLFATISELAGLPAVASDGVSIKPLLFGGPRFQRPSGFLYFEYPEKGGQLAVLMGEWKGVRTNLLKNPEAPWELFNLQQDPSEKKNLAGQHPDMIEKMKQVVAREHEHPVILDWEVVDRIQK